MSFNDKMHVLFAWSFERLPQDQLFNTQVLMRLAAAGLRSSHFRVGKCHRRM